MTRSDMARAFHMPGRSHSPTIPSVNITSPTNVYTDAEPRNDLRPLPSHDSTPKRPKLSLMPVVTPQERSRPTVAPLPLLDAAAALRYQNQTQLGIGMAVGSPSQAQGQFSGLPAVAPPALGSEPFSANPSSFSSVPFSPVSSPGGYEDAAQPRGPKWKMLGGLFSKKPINDLPSLQPAASPGSAAIIPAPAWTPQPSKRREDGVRVNQHRRQLSRSLELPRERVEVPRTRAKQQSPSRVQKPRTLQKSPSLRKPFTAPVSVASKPSPHAPLKDKPMPPVPSEEPPMLQVEIPDVKMERYSIMFGNVLNPRQSTLMQRRQAQLERLKLREANEKDMPQIPRELTLSPEQNLNNLSVPTRRATLPSPTKSPSYSLFPSSNIRGSSPVPKSHSPTLLQRTWTAPALSPGVGKATKATQKTTPLVKAEKLPQRSSNKRVEQKAGSPLKSAQTVKEMCTSKALEPAVDVSPQMAINVSKGGERQKPKLAPLQQKHFPEGDMPVTIVETEEDGDTSPVGESPTTPTARWEPKVSPRPHRSTSLGDAETDPRDQSGDIVIQIASSPQPWHNSVPEPREGTIELLGTPVYVMPSPVPAAKPAPPLSPGADRAAAMNKPLPTPVPELGKAANDTPSAVPNDGPHTTQQQPENVDWHVLSPRNASLNKGPEYSLQHKPRKASLPTLPIQQATALPPQEGPRSAKEPRQSSAAAKPSRPSRGLPPKTTIGRGSVSASSPVSAPNSATVASPPAASKPPTSTTPLQGSVPNPLGSAPASAAEISIARQISISRRQQMLVPIVPRMVRPPQQAQLVEPETPTSADSITTQLRYQARKSHHVTLESV